MERDAAAALDVDDRHVTVRVVLWFGGAAGGEDRRVLDEQDATRVTVAMHGRLQPPHAFEHRDVVGTAKVFDFDGQGGRLTNVIPFVTCMLLLSPQGLQVEPRPAVVGHELRFTAMAGAAPRAGLAVEVELPTGERRAIGSTDGAGIVRFVPDQVGHHVFVAQIDGVRTLVPFHVDPERKRWLLALGAVPLGLVLLRANLRRARGRPGL
jgi:predicted RNA binding protein YcfA (HicA-like mRNA interferase family)